MRSVGRCSMLVRDQVVEQAEIASGETIVLRNALVLLAVRRPALCERGSRANDPWVFPFGRPDSYGIIGESPAIWALRADLELAAESGQHVLLHGASGTGKELAARAIHALSPRRDKAFVARNAATVPEGLVDAELFGTSRGYPNAGSPERTGLLAEADGGTLFLDEIGELAPHLQAHLLRALDSGGEYQRLGDPSARRSDLRVVVATNRPLDHLKSDFAARFTFRVCVPGFEERREDIPLLLRHLLARAAETTPSAQRIFERRAGVLAEPRLDSSLVDALVRHHYSLHMRELQRLLWVAFASNNGNFLALTPDLCAELRFLPPSEAALLSGSPEPRVDAAALDRSVIEAALSRAKGNITGAARLLGLKNRYALYRLMKRHGIAHPDEDDRDSGA